MLKKNCHQVLGSQKSKLTPSELVFKTAGVINSPPPNKERVNIENLQFWRMSFFKTLSQKIPRKRYQVLSFPKLRIPYRVVSPGHRVTWYIEGISWLLVVKTSWGEKS